MMGSSFMFPWGGLLLVMLVIALLVLAVYARRRLWKIVLGLSAPVVLIASCVGLILAGSGTSQQVNVPAPAPATLSLALLASRSLPATFDTLNARTGALRWQQSFGNSVVQVAADDHTLYLTTGAAALALRAQDGGVLWHTPLNPGGNVPVAPVVADGLIYVASLAGSEVTIEALHTQDGTLAWSLPHAPFPVTSLAAGAGRLYIGSYSRTIIALRSTDGARVWSWQGTIGAHGQLAGPAYASGLVYAADSGQVVARRASDGTEVWSHPLAAFLANTQLDIGANSIYVQQLELTASGSPDDLYSFNSQTGRLQWKYPVRNAFYARAIEAGPLVYVASDRYLDALRVSDGRRVWRHSSTGNVGFGPPLIANGVLFVRSFPLNPGEGMPCPQECEPIGVNALNASTGSLYWRIAWSAMDPGQSGLLGVTDPSS